MPDSSLSRPTVLSDRCEATIELGKRLTKELGIDQSVDTLGRWMAHYIAELIEDARTASVEERPEKMGACCEAILSLWKHRQDLPEGRRPFQNLEAMIRTLASLDPENSTPRYFPSTRTAADLSNETDKTRTWLELIEALDHSARILIRYCMSQAAETAIDKSVEWVRLAEAAGAKEGVEFPIVRVIFQDKAQDPPSDENALARERTENRIKRLEAFSKMATEVASTWRKQLRQTMASAKTSPVRNTKRKKDRS